MQQIGIIAPNYQRPHIFQIWCAAIKRLREDTGVHIPAIVVSEVEDKAICKKYDIVHITQQNKPVSEKFNTACFALKGKCDYVLITGSDDIISSRTFNRILAEAEKGYDLIGVNSIYFVSTDGANKGKIVKLVAQNRMLGVAKTISAKVLDKVGWKPWNVEKNWGLDAICSNAIKPYVQTTKILEDTEIFDLKDRVQSLNKFSFWFGKLGNDLQDAAKLWSSLGAEETELLKQILR